MAVVQQGNTAFLVVTVSTLAAWFLVTIAKPILSGMRAETVATVYTTKMTFSLTVTTVTHALF